MGESIVEGTIVRWIKKVGEKVDQDEPLFEISTDKVDAEIPSPAAGIVAEIRVKEGETVAIHSVVAVIGQEGDAVVPSLQSPVSSRRANDDGQISAVEGRPVVSIEQSSIHNQQSAIHVGAMSPVVRRIAQEHHVDFSQIRGTGAGGRVTKRDILSYVASGPTATAEHVRPPAPGDRVEKMSVMRKKIADHMVESRRLSAHVHTAFEVNFARVAAIRESKKADYERAGAKLTFLSFIVKAAVDALAAMPVLNASINGENVVYHTAINVGIAVALDWGLIVPVIRNAAGKSLLDLSREVADLASRARAKQLKPEEVGGGTFTITNQGVSGALFGLPIINQPQVAILGVGSIDKRPVVVGDTIVIKPTAYLTLGFDHRLIDGAVADEFLSRLKAALENWDPANA
jgi:2-oxoglutarate dehydrogenase E2 component (dihydrolipoamide succinyltransferase)